MPEDFSKVVPRSNNQHTKIEASFQDIKSCKTDPGKTNCLKDQVCWVIQESMNSSAVMKNRISWRKFDQMRKDECLDSQPSSSLNRKTPSRHHGSTNHLSEETKQQYSMRHKLGKMMKL